MATGTLGTSARELPFQAVHYLRKTITFADRGVAKTVGVIPANAAVVAGEVFVTTAFNGGGTDTVDVGHAGDPNAFATLLDVSGAGLKALDELAAATNDISTSDRTVTATYNDQNGDSSAGSAEVIVRYVVL